MKSKLLILYLLALFLFEAKSFALAPKTQAKDELHPFDLATQDIITLENYQKIENGNKFILSVDFSKEEEGAQKKSEELLTYILSVSYSFNLMISQHLKHVFIFSGRYLLEEILNQVDLYFVLKELIKNAFVHGNEMNLSHNVFIGWYIDEMGDFVIEIGDHGKNLDIDLNPGNELREYEKNAYELAGLRSGLKRSSNLFLIVSILPVYNKEDVQTGKIIRLIYKLKTINLKKLDEYRNRFPKTWNFKTSRLENVPLMLRDAA